MARPTSLRRIFLRLRAKAAKRDGKAGRAGAVSTWQNRRPLHADRETVRKGFENRRISVIYRLQMLQSDQPYSCVLPHREFFQLKAQANGRSFVRSVFFAL